MWAEGTSLKFLIFELSHHIFSTKILATFMLLCLPSSLSFSPRWSGEHDHDPFPPFAKGLWTSEQNDCGCGDHSARVINQRKQQWLLEDAPLVHPRFSIFISKALQDPALWFLFIFILLLYFASLYHASFPFHVLLSDRVIFSDLSGNYFSNVVIIVLCVRPLRVGYLCCDIPLGLNCIGIYSCS